MQSTGPSQKELTLLKGMKDYFQEHGYNVSIREVCALVGTNSTSVAAYHLSRLEKFGLIERIPYVARGIRFIDNVDKKPVPIRSPKTRIIFHAVTVLGCKMRRFPPWPVVNKLAA